MSYLDKFFKNKAVVLIFIGFLIGAAFSPLFVSATDYASKHGEDSSNTAWETTGQGMISTSKDGRLFNATGADLINAVSYASGHEVRVPGYTTIAMSAVLVLENNTQLVGAGNSSRLVLDDASNCNMISATDSTNIRIKDLFIDGNGDGQTVANDYRCILFWECSASIVENCYITNSTEVGIKFWLGSDNSIVNCDVSYAGPARSPTADVGPYGIWFAGESGSSVLNCNVHDCYSGGIAIEYSGASYGSIPSRYCEVIGNTCYKNTAGIWLENSANCTITANTCYNNTKEESYGSAQAHIVIGGGARFITVTSNNIFGESGHGILVYGDDVELSSNTIRNLTGMGIYFGSSGIRNTAIANIIKNTGSYGIGLENPYSMASLNTITSATTYGINMDNHCSAIGNIITNTPRSIRASGKSNLLISENQINASLSEGIYLESSCTDSIISKNIITYSADQGIEIKSSNNITISENIITDSDNAAIYLNAAVNCTLFVNRLSDTGSGDQDYGILESATANFNYVFMNNVQNNLVDGVLLQGDSSIMLFNIGNFTIFPSVNVSSAMNDYEYLNGWFDTANSRLWVNNNGDWMSTGFS